MSRSAKPLILAVLLLEAVARAQASDAFHAQQDQAYAIFEVSRECAETWSFVGLFDDSARGPIAVFILRRRDLCADSVVRCGGLP